MLRSNRRCNGGRRGRMQTMARWRAVPTAVWTAAGALAFLAAGGVAVVLGAGLHVWSGPSTPAVPAAISAAHPRGSGVVIVSPPAPARRSGGPAPSAVSPLPFVPFGTASGSSSEPPTAAPAVAPTVSGPVAPSSHGRALGLLRDQPQRLLFGLRALRPASTAAELIVSPTRVARTSVTSEGHAARHQGRHEPRAQTRHRHRHYHKHHGHGRGDARHGDARHDRAGHGHPRPYDD
jgi:hypothetical protein